MELELEGKKSSFSLFRKISNAFDEYKITKKTQNEQKEFESLLEKQKKEIENEVTNLINYDMLLTVYDLTKAGNILTRSQHSLFTQKVMNKFMHVNHETRKNDYIDLLKELKKRGYSFNKEDVKKYFIESRAYIHERSNFVKEIYPELLEDKEFINESINKLISEIEIANKNINQAKLSSAKIADIKDELRKRNETISNLFNLFIVEVYQETKELIELESYLKLAKIFREYTLNVKSATIKTYWLEGIVWKNAEDLVKKSNKNDKEYYTQHNIYSVYSTLRENIDKDFSNKMKILLNDVKVESGNNHKIIESTSIELNKKYKELLEKINNNLNFLMLNEKFMSEEQLVDIKKIKNVDIGEKIKELKESEVSNYLISMNNRLNESKVIVNANKIRDLAVIHKYSSSLKMIA